MSAVLPGKPVSRLQGLATGSWGERNIIAYATGSALTILDGPRSILQTIYDDGDEDLTAVSIDDATGKIAVCSKASVRIYKPSKLPEDSLKWALEGSFEAPHATSTPHVALSWGRDEELLVASSLLSLFTTKSETRCSWEQRLPNNVKSASLSYDSAYIVSVGHYDRLPKVWRRLAYGRDEVRFDHAYLRHPNAVTSVRWRKPLHAEQTDGNLLYTVCIDGTVRVWTPTETADAQHWQLWCSIDTNEAVRNIRNVVSPSVVYIVDGKDFMPAVERAVQERLTDDPSKDEVAMEHLIAIANKTPEICLAINTSGVMTAWALDTATNAKTQESRVFAIAHAKSRIFENLAGFRNASNMSHIEVQSYFDKTDGALHILFHAFDGRIGHFTSDVADLLSPTANEQRLHLQSVWSGHSASIKKMNRNFSGRAVVSRTETGECVVWNHPHHAPDASQGGLSRRCIISTGGDIRRVCVLRKGRFVVFLASKSISLWDCRSETSLCLGQLPLQLRGDSLCLIALPRPDVKDATRAYIATVTSERDGQVWEIVLPAYLEGDSTTTAVGIYEFCSFTLCVPESLKYVLPVDPAGTNPIVSGFLDVFARDIAISYTRGGRVDFWTARVDLKKRNVDWLSTCYTETGMSDPALASGSMLKKAALVNSARSQLTIWDIGGSRLEFKEVYEQQNVIQDLDWTSTPDGQSILAVGFPYRVILLSQMRFDYLNRGPAWAQIREISIRELTPHPIGDSTWLGDGHLVIGTGNQMFVYDRRVGSSDIATPDLRLPQRKDGSWDLFEAVQRFNGPLPIFHPQFLSQSVLCGKATMVRRILVALHRTLKYLVPGEQVDDYLGLDAHDFYSIAEGDEQTPSKGNRPYINGDALDHEADDTFTEQIASLINETLTKVRIPQLSGHEQIQLMDMIECAALVERHRRSMDENGARFMLFFRQHALRKGRTSEIHLSWREINWAYHSNSQDILVDFVSRQAHGSMVWRHARESGLFMWLSDLPALKAQFEVIARNEYTSSDSKNPVDCSLFYLALKKKTVLQGLWRMASGNREQAATQRLLANSFDDPKWKTVALKNAYALLSKRRFQYAAAFFLLANKLEDAVEVCLRQLRDMQLAIAVARIYEGDNGPVLKKLLHDEVLVFAAQEGDRWLASWAFWMLGRKDMAVRALITPVYTLLETPSSPDLKSRLFLTDDPALVVLYSQLRHKTLQTLRGASKVNPRVEWEFVLHSAKLYDRMGCDLLGLDLVRNWEFQQVSPAGFGGDFNPLKLLRRRSSLVVNDLPAVHLEAAARSDKKRTTPPTTFEEPDAGSLLDSFGL